LEGETEALSVAVASTSKEDAPLKLIEFTKVVVLTEFTVTLFVPTAPLESFAVAVITAEPAPTPVTAPPALTVAMPVSLLLQVRLESVAVSGKTVAASEIVAATSTELAPLSETLETKTTAVVTVMECEPVTPLASLADAVIVAEPAPTPETVPLLLTVATAVLLLDHVRLLFVALDG
jgi:hypothetical protein